MASNTARPTPARPTHCDLQSIINQVTQLKRTCGKDLAFIQCSVADGDYHVACDDIPPLRQKLMQSLQNILNQLVDVKKRVSKDNLKHQNQHKLPNSSTPITQATANVNSTSFTSTGTKTASNTTLPALAPAPSTPPNDLKDIDDMTLSQIMDESMFDSNTTQSECSQKNTEANPSQQLFSSGTTPECSQNNTEANPSQELFGSGTTPDNEKLTEAEAMHELSQ